MWRKKKSINYHFRVLFKDNKNLYDAPEEDGLKLMGIFLDQTLANYALEGYLNNQYLNWFYNAHLDEYQIMNTHECVGRIKKVHG